MEHLEFKAEIKVSDEGGIEGIAWPFGSPDRVGDVIQKGAFKKTKLPLPMLAFHDSSDPVGVWTHLVEDDHGLKLKGNMLVGEVARAREVRALVQSGAAGGLSIGFITKKAKARNGGGREISEVELVECSIVTIPSHPGARVTSAKDATAALAITEAINRANAALKR